jgi:hypothetical protein
MNSQELRALQEAYSQVYGLDEEERPIYGRGGKLRRTETPLEVLGKQATARDKKTKHNIPRGGRTFPAGKPDEGNPSSLRSGDYDRGKGNKAAKRVAALNKEQVDLYDIILSHLLDEGYADTEQAAEAIMVNMSEDWRESIVEGEEKKEEPQKPFTGEGPKKPKGWRPTGPKLKSGQRPGYAR